MMTIAVTGGIGSGKSLVCSLLAGRGVPVYDSDAAAKRLYADDEGLLDAAEAAFGVSLRKEDGAPDLRKLASIVFPSQEKLAILEGIVHPAVLRDFQRWKALQEVRGAQIAVIESAIILSKPAFLSAVDRVLLVDAPASTRLSRACQRDGATPSSVIERMARQHFDLSRVDEVLWNDGSVAELAEKTEAILRGWESLIQKK